MVCFPFINFPVASPQLLLILTFGSHGVDYLLYRAHNMFHLQGFGTEHFLMYDSVISCTFTCIFFPHLLLNPADQTTLLTTHHGRTICCQSIKIIPRQTHFTYTVGYLFKAIFPYGGTMCWEMRMLGIKPPSKPLLLKLEWKSIKELIADETKMTVFKSLNDFGQKYTYKMFSKNFVLWRQS